MTPRDQHRISVGDDTDDLDVVLIFVAWTVSSWYQVLCSVFVNFDHYMPAADTLSLSQNALPSKI